MKTLQEIYELAKKKNALVKENNKTYMQVRLHKGLDGKAEWELIMPEKEKS